MFHRQPMALFCLCLGVGLIGVLSSVLPLFSDAEENLGLQLLYRMRGPEKTPDNVFLVAIDSESAKAMHLPLNPRHWPRRLHSQLIDQLNRRQASVVAFDLLFQEHQDEINDQAFADAMRRAGNVVLTQAIDRQTLPLSDQDTNRNPRVMIERTVSAIPVLADAAVAQAPFPLPKVPIKLNQFWCFRSASGNSPTLPVVAFHIFAGNVLADFIDLLADVDPQPADTVAVASESTPDARSIVQLSRALRMRFEEDATLAARMLERLKQSSEGGMSPRSMRLIRSLLGLYGSGSSRYLNFYGPAGSIRTISYHRLVDTEAVHPFPEKPRLPKNAAVFVGQTDSNWIKTHDEFYTTFSSESGHHLSGVEIAATAFANLLEDKGVYPLGLTGRLMLLAGWSVLVVLISLYLNTLFSIAGLALLSGIYFTIALGQFKSGGIWYPLVVPLLIQLPAAFVTGLLTKYRKVSIERRNIREAVGYYLPDDVVDRLAGNLKSMNLGGQLFYGVCMFTDAQNYTTLSESMDPGRLTDLMNAYYAAVFGPIKANGGMVLQVVGDSVLALWTASEAKSEIKHAACQAALEITRAVDRFNRRVGPHAMPTRVGIHAGDMLLGNIGAMNHFEYRPVGDIVNTASRLEGLNKFLGTHVLVSHDAISPDMDFPERSVGRFVFKGKSRPVHVHELLAPDNLEETERNEFNRLFASGLAAFQGGQWREAMDWFDQALRVDPGDGPSRFYIDRCRRYTDRPPDGTWDGVIRLDKK